MKYVSEKSNCSAWAVLKGNKEVGKVQAHFGNSKVTVNVWDLSKDNGFQASSASGYGYDQLTSALSGCTIDGIALTDHCGHNEKTEKLLKNYIKANKKGNFTIKQERYYQKQAEKLGACFVNWSYFYNGIKGYHFKGNKAKTLKTAHYTSLYLAAGLRKLEMLGYTVIQVI